MKRRLRWSTRRLSECDGLCLFGHESGRAAEAAPIRRQVDRGGMSGGGPGNTGGASGSGGFGGTDGDRCERHRRHRWCDRRHRRIERWCDRRHRRIERWCDRRCEWFLRARVQWTRVRPARCDKRRAERDEPRVQPTFLPRRHARSLRSGATSPSRASIRRSNRPRRAAAGSTASTISISRRATIRPSRTRSSSEVPAAAAR